MTSYDLVVDVAKYPLNQDFDVKINATLWNGDRDPKEAWIAYLVRAPLTAFSFTLQLAEAKKPPVQPKVVQYLPGSEIENDLPSSDYHMIFQPEFNRLYWRVSGPKVDHTYELQWTW